MFSEYPFSEYLLSYCPFSGCLYKSCNMDGNSGTPSMPNVVGYSTASIQKLDGTNFLTWKRQICAILKLRGLSKALTEDVDEEVDLKATLVLLETMDNNHKLQVQTETTAKSIMTTLERQYADTSASNKHRLLSEYFRSNKEPGDTMAQHIASLQENHSEEMFQVIVINSVGAEYAIIMEIWDTTHVDLKTDVLINLLLKREQVLNQQTDQVLLTQRGQGQKINVVEIKKISKCSRCGQKGHWYISL